MKIQVQDLVIMNIIRLITGTGTITDSGQVFRCSIYQESNFIGFLRILINKLHSIGVFNPVRTDTKLLIKIEVHIFVDTVTESIQNLKVKCFEAVGKR